MTICYLRKDLLVLTIFKKYEFISDKLDKQIISFIFLSYDNVFFVILKSKLRKIQDHDI